MPTTPARSKAAHDAIGRYRSALADAQGIAATLRRLSDAAKALAPFVTSTLPAIGWQGPPVAEWEGALPDLIAETKSGLAA